ncbi:hypothetical protein QTN47_18955 [Danxiaibacter flavus]|uniref:Uncharacterized protein n=1 Tax=Danxiaibacter flavus TaxID=3049108 RepID=A0ABV3ZI71_9BACT|nr:hypothetical protein QNM32_18965 [Chitinophagaceae bacterium DXS]
MDFNDTEINEIYLFLDDLFALKIKAQLKGTGLFLKEFERVIDMHTDEQSYQLVVNKFVF